jgi:Mrp family chromosome partitioning ATPase
MSWFYEALLRAEKNRSRPGRGTDTSISDQGGESSRTAIRSYSLVSGESSEAKPETRSAAVVLTDEDIPRPSLHVSRQVPLATTFEPSKKAVSPNGFRHLTLPLREESRLVFHTDPNGLAAEQFRLLRRTLNQEFGGGGVLMTTSPGVGDGKTLLSLNLSTCLADSGDSTLFVEADLRRPTARKLLGGTVEPPGIEDALAGDVEPGQAVHWIKELSLHTALVAKIPRDPFHVFNGTGVQRFLAWAREHFRWVVLDTAPVLPAADVAELLPFVDAVLLVVRAQSTPRELSKRAFEMLGKRLHGVIFNEATIDSNPYYGYLDQSYLASGTKQEERGRPEPK